MKKVNNDQQSPTGDIISKLQNQQQNRLMKFNSIQFQVVAGIYSNNLFVIKTLKIETKLSSSKQCYEIIMVLLGRCSPSSTLMHVPTKRGPKAAHRPSGRKLSPPSFPPRFRCNGGRIVLAYGCVNDQLRLSRPGGR